MERICGYNYGLFVIKIASQFVTLLFLD